MSTPKSSGWLIGVAVAILLVLAGLVAPPASSEPGDQPSPTPTELQITRFYTAVLDRQPDQDGMGYWYRLLSTGADPVAIAEAFAQSEEFRLRFGVPTGSAGDLAFLDRVYLNVLDRSPDPEGRRYWKRQLDAGVPRSHIVLFFSESTEFGNRTGLIPPSLPQFSSELQTVSAADLGVSWRPGCPVEPEDLRLLRVAFVDYSGQAATGEIVVHADAAEDIVVVFQRLYEARYPIQSIRTIDEFDGSDDASMEANNTSAFNCRTAVSSTRWSRHAFGRAVDLNPRVNPYVRGSTVLPEAGRLFTDRTVHDPALIREGDKVTEAFDSIKWQWGGRWRTVKDYQHFSADGR